MVEIPSYALPLLAVIAGFYAIFLGQGLPIGPSFLKGKEYARIIGVVLVIGGSLKLLFSGAPPEKEMPAALPTAADIVTEMKKKRPLPLQLDDLTTLIGLEAGERKIIYTVSLNEKGEKSYQLATATIRELPKQACGNKDYLTFFKLGLTIETKYMNADGEHVGTLTIAPDQCGL